MRRSEPVLTDPDDVRIWNKIDDDGHEEKKKIRQHDKLSIMAVVDDALTTGKELHSAVLVKMLRKAAAEKISNLESVAIKILDMRRPGDMYPLMEAADIVLKDGNLDISRSLMERMENVPDTAFKEYLEGMLASRSGNETGALEHLIRSNAVDQSFIRTYDLLISIDPGKGWDVLRNILLIMSGERPGEVHADDADLFELQEIYDRWYNGDRGSARERLETSGGFLSGHLDFLLAAARMTADVEEYERSAELYGRILAQYPNIDSIIVERANILTAAGRRNDALTLLETLNEENGRNRNVMECKLRALASKSAEKEFLPYSEGFLASEHGDKAAHILVCDLMSGIGMYEGSGKILSMLVSMFPYDLDIHLKIANNEIRLGRYTSALKAADRIVKLSPKAADGHCLRAKIHLNYGRLKSAMKEGERALRLDPGHIGSLIVMKDLRIQLKEYDRSQEMCQRILMMDPANADTVLDLAYSLDMLGKRQEAVEEYKNALRLRNDAGVLSAILASLIKRNRPEEAADIAKEFVSDEERNAGVWMLKGNAEYRSADHRSASRSYAKALEIRPHDAKLWHSRGMAEEMAGMYKDAESSYDRAVIMDLDNPSYWLSKAIVQEKRGDLKGSVLSLNRVISESPDNVFALVRKARILAFAGRNEDALFFLDHALKVDGMNIKILEMKKNIYRHAERYEDVIESCKAILRIDKKNIIALTDMAETFQRIGRHDDALKVLDTVSSDLGEVGVLMMKKHSAGLNGNTEVEIESCRSILKIEPNNRNVKLELADALIRNGDHADAMKVYDEVHEEDPRDAEVIVLRGKLRALMADEANTVELYHEAVLDNPDDPDILNKLAATLCDSGEYDEAYGMISRAIEISPDVAEFHMTGARILMAKNDPEGALKMLNSALNDVPDRGEIYLRIGEIHERLKNYDDALTAYDSALREGADANYRKGRVQELKGDREDAKNSYSAAVSSDADNVRALERLGTMQFEDKEYAAARRNLDSALKADPFDTSSLLSRARLYVKEGIAGKAVPIYRTLSSRDDSTDEIRNELNILLAGYEGPPAAEHTIEKTAEKPDTEKETADIRERVTEKDAADMGSTYDLALAALERAYETGSAISDDDMLAGLGITGDKKDMVLDYLSGIEEYGTIDVSSEEFERMERLSKNVILAECIDDIDSNPLVGIPAAFMASTAETIDDAKKLIAYIYKAVTDDSVPVVFSDEVREYAKEASEMSGDISTYTLMKMFNVGVYTAGTIAKLAKRSKKGADIHI